MKRGPTLTKERSINVSAPSSREATPPVQGVVASEPASRPPTPPPPPPPVVPARDVVLQDLLTELRSFSSRLASVESQMNSFSDGTVLGLGGGSVSRKRCLSRSLSPCRRSPLHSGISTGEGKSRRLGVAVRSSLEPGTPSSAQCHPSGTHGSLAGQPSSPSSEEDSPAEPDFQFSFEEVLEAVRAELVQDFPELRAPQSELPRRPVFHGLRPEYSFSPPLPWSPVALDLIDSLGHRVSSAMPPHPRPSCFFSNRRVFRWFDTPAVHPGSFHPVNRGIELLRGSAAGLSLNLSEDEALSWETSVFRARQGLSALDWQQFAVRSMLLRRWEASGSDEDALLVRLLSALGRSLSLVSREVYGLYGAMISRRRDAYISSLPPQVLYSDRQRLRASSFSGPELFDSKTVDQISSSVRESLALAGLRPPRQSAASVPHAGFVASHEVRKSISRPAPSK